MTLYFIVMGKNSIDATIFITQFKGKVDSLRIAYWLIQHPIFSASVSKVKY